MMTIYITRMRSNDSIILPWMSEDKMKLKKNQDYLISISDTPRYILGNP